MPKISIIVPIYNVEKYLTNCIDSILNQTFKDFELILVNDGSTDNSFEICKHYKDIDDRICIIDKKNGGLSSARNAGLDIAKGEYIGFVDSDDYIHPQMYELLYNQIIKNKADISMCEFKKVSEFNKKELSDKVILNQEVEILNNKEAVFKLGENGSVTYVIACNKLYKKSLFNNIKFKEGIIHEDEYIIHRLLYQVKTLVYIKEKLYFYLQREGSIMDKKSNINSADYLLACSDRVRFFYEKDLIQLKDKWEKFYLWKFFNDYSELHKEYNGNKKLKILRKDFAQLLKILLKEKKYSLKEKVSWIVFAINPNIYYKIVK
ncbi:glycosyltransferase [Clostridium sp. 1001270J_160509_D11]|uniref:glycosyltransferase family 2 protein n=1 Tax=Clostridia TaxID=186801 RepID=UPI0018A9EB67|nr:glycosyltransferase [Clostridium sp. 1001270J_160509_D11]